MVSYIPARDGKNDNLFLQHLLKELKTQRPSQECVPLTGCMRTELVLSMDERRLWEARVIDPDTAPLPSPTLRSIPLFFQQAF